MKRTLAASIAVLVLLTSSCSQVQTPTPESTPAATAGIGSSDSFTPVPEVPTIDGGLADQDLASKQLTYLIEEEKLAHDVYQAMYDLWGARAFGNILRSEENHQSQVLAVMTSMKISDIRADASGVFQNEELQKLFDQLIEKGSRSLVDAYEVGVAIEELDIADLTKMLATATDPNAIAMMENLRQGSENHLRAFNSKL
jgi:hypothetical protein